LRVFHPNPSRFHTAHTPRSRSEQEYISCQTLHREIFVHGSDDGSFRFGHDKVVGIVWNRASGCDRRKASTTSRTDHTVHDIAMKKGPAAPALSGDSVRQHFHDRIEILPRKVAIRVSPFHEFKQS